MGTLGLYNMSLPGSAVDDTDQLDWDRVDDSAAERPDRISNTVATINLTKCFVGAASFELPWAFMQAGIGGAVGGVCALAIGSRVSLSLLAQCGHLVKGRPHPTYPEIGRAAFGAVGFWAAWAGIVAMTLGVCGSYVVFVASTLADLTSPSKFDWILLQLPLLIVLSWLRAYKFLSLTALLGVLALIVAVIVTTIDCAKHSTWKEHDYSLHSFSWMEVYTYPLFLGNAGYLYLISTAILPLSQSMSTPSKFGSCLSISILFVTVINLAFGLYAWFSYGQCPSSDGSQCTQGNVIDNLTAGHITTAVKLALCVDLVFTNLMFLLPVSEALEAEFFASPEHTQLSEIALGSKSIDHASTPSCYTGSKNALEPLYKHTPERDPACNPADAKTSSFEWCSKREWARNGIRTALCIGVAFTAYGIPSFHLLTGLSGGFGNNLLGFILPPIFYIKLRHRDGFWSAVDWGSKLGRSRGCELWGCVIIFVLGIVFMVISTASYINKVVN